MTRVPHDDSSTTAEVYQMDLKKEAVAKAKAVKDAADKAEADAEAEAEMIRRRARGEADAILFMKQAEAKGIYEVLTKQAEGLKQIVAAAGNNSKDAVLLLIADKLPELVKMQSEAIKNIKIDKITVWEGGNGPNDKSSTANFISGLYKSVPPLQEMFTMAGMELPEYLKGKTPEEIEQLAEEVKNVPAESKTKKNKKSDSDDNVDGEL
jgi:flotillin